MKLATISALSYFMFIVIVCATIIGSGDAGKKRKITHPNTSGNTDGTAGTSNSMDIPTKVAKKSGTASPNGEDGKRNAAGKLKMKPTIATSIVKNRKQKRHKNTKKVTANKYTAKASKVTVAGENKKVHETTKQMSVVNNNNKSFAAESKLTVSNNNNSNVEEEEDEMKKDSELRRHCQQQCCEQHCAGGDDRGGVDGNSPAAAGLTAATLLLRNNKNANMTSRVKRMAGTCRECGEYYTDPINFCHDCCRKIVDEDDPCANASADEYDCDDCKTKNGCDYLDGLYREAEKSDRCEWDGDEDECKQQERQDPCMANQPNFADRTCSECTSEDGCDRLTAFRQNNNTGERDCTWEDDECQYDHAPGASQPSTPTSVGGGGYGGPFYDEYSEDENYI